MYYLLPIILIVAYILHSIAIERKNSKIKKLQLQLSFELDAQDQQLEYLKEELYVIDSLKKQLTEQDIAMLSPVYNRMKDHLTALEHMQAVRKGIRDDYL
ncbi:hypothetical protein GZZ44_10535 [Klebsiella aerogenes]|uniref:hypothetical protein n=1 Tax=Klebsiella aerogenes TaxID=548 RepID=UPI00190EAA15|nr:hypothetical protein [Klebsiella aerogenes]MBK0633384.1 hypothetical protein [Klebsiella aerogenes]